MKNPKTTSVLVGLGLVLVLSFGYAQGQGNQGSYITPLPGSGTVRAQDTLVRFERPGLTEEYSASLDGIRQDFVIAERPAGADGLCVELNRAASKKQIPISSVQFSSVQSAKWREALKQIMHSLGRCQDRNLEFTAISGVPKPTQTTPTTPT